MTLEETVLKRFSWKLLGNILVHMFGFLSLMIVTRSISPSEFGQLEFVNKISSGLFQFFMFSSPTGYFIWVSKGRDGAIRGVLYSLIYLIILLIIFLSIFIFVKGLGGYNLLFPSVEPRFVILGLIFGSLSVLNVMIQHLSDGIALVSVFEKIKTICSLLKVGMFYVAFLFGFMSVPIWFLISILSIISLILFFLIYLYYNKIEVGDLVYKRGMKQDPYLRYILKYSKNFLFLSVLTFAYSQFEVWYLQFVGGNIEQASFGVASRLILIVSVFFSSFTPILARDYSYHIKNNNFEKLRDSFNLIKVFYIISSFVCIGVISFSELILDFISGGQFVYASSTLILMSLYPIHQCLGQLSGFLILASGKERFYAKLSSFSILLYMPLLIVLVSPEDSFVSGFGMGAVGVSLMKVIVQIFTVNIQLYENCKFLEISFLKWTVFQVVPIVIFLFIGKLVTTFSNLEWFSIVLYILISLFLFAISPRLFIVEREELLEIKELFFSKFNKENE